MQLVIDNLFNNQDIRPLTHQRQPKYVAWVAPRLVKQGIQYQLPDTFWQDIHQRRFAHSTNPRTTQGLHTNTGHMQTLSP